MTKKKIKKEENKLNWLQRLRRSIGKRRRRKTFEKRQKVLREAEGEVLQYFEPFINRLLEESVADYHSSMQQNTWTIQAGHDIKKFFKLKIKSFINSNR